MSSGSSRYRPGPGRIRAAISAMIAAALVFGSAAAGAQCTADGAPARLDFTLQDMNGNDVSLADYEGSVILIDFWATWCAPCRVEIPGFIEMVEQYGPQGFAVLGISIDDSPEDLRLYAAEMAMNYPVLIGDGRDDVKDAYGPLIGFPTAYIIDRDGRICHRHIGFTPKDRFIEDVEGLL